MLPVALLEVAPQGDVYAQEDQADDGEQDRGRLKVLRPLATDQHPPQCEEDRQREETGRRARNDQRVTRPVRRVVMAAVSPVAVAVLKHCSDRSGIASTPVSRELRRSRRAGRQG